MKKNSQALSLRQDSNPWPLHLEQCRTNFCFSSSMKWGSKLLFDDIMICHYCTLKSGHIYIAHVHVDINGLFIFKNLYFFFLNLSFSFVLQFVPGSGTWPPEQRWARWVGILWTQHGQGQTDLPGESRSNVRFQELLPYAPKQDHRACSSKCALDQKQNIYTVYNTINFFSWTNTERRLVCRIQKPLSDTEATF